MQVGQDGGENEGTVGEMPAACSEDIRKETQQDWKRGQGAGNRKHKRERVSEKMEFLHAVFPQVGP